MKIAHLTPTFFSKSSVIGGGERYVYNLAKALRLASQKGNHVFEQKIVSVGAQSESFTHKGINIQLLESCTSHQVGTMTAISDQLWAALRDIDLVHLHQSLTLFGAYSLAIAKSMGIPIIATDLGGGENDLMLYGKGLELCDGVLSISEFAKSLILSNFSGKHHVLIGPTDTDFFKPNNSIQRKNNTAICVGRILPHKGFDQVIQALPSSMELLIVGQPYNSEYFEFLKSTAQGKKVKFINDANDIDLVKLYQSSSVFIQASVHKDCYGNIHEKPELMGLTTLEALSCGLPTIVSNSGSLPELVPDVRFGKVFSSIPELNQILNQVANAEWPSKNAGDLARSHVVQKHSFLSIGESLLDFYYSVSERSKSLSQ